MLEGNIQLGIEGNGYGGGGRFIFRKSRREPNKKERKSTKANNPPDTPKVIRRVVVNMEPRRKRRRFPANPNGQAGREPNQEVTITTPTQHYDPWEGEMPARGIVTILGGTSKRAIRKRKRDARRRGW